MFHERWTIPLTRVSVGNRRTRSTKGHNEKLRVFSRSLEGSARRVDLKHAHVISHTLL